MGRNATLNRFERQDRKDAESCGRRGGESRRKHLSATFRRVVAGVSKLPTSGN